MSRSSYLISLVLFLGAVVVVFSWKAARQQRLQAFSLQLMAPFNGATSSLGRKVQAAAQGLKTLPQLETENGHLRVENQQLKITNQMLNGLAQENESLRRALSFRARSTFKLIPARVIARQTSTWWNSVQIDRGEQDGLDIDMPVVIDEGLVGKTTTVGATSSYVLLVADENCKVAATVEGTRESGILNGVRTGLPELKLNYLEKTAVQNLHPGQKVVSSGVGGVFPGGLLLGTIKEIEVRSLDASAQVTPAADLAHLENVFVIVNQREGNVGGPPSPVPARAR